MSRYRKSKKRYIIKNIVLDDIDEDPFDIHETWKWVQLQDIVKKTIKMREL